MCRVTIVIFTVLAFIIVSRIDVTYRVNAIFGTTITITSIKVIVIN